MTHPADDYDDIEVPDEPYYMPLPYPHNVFFGEHWGVPALEGLHQVETPVGSACYYCTEEIVGGDRGFFRPVGRLNGGENVTTIEPIHRECDYRSVAGGLAHHMGECKCYGGNGKHDLDGMTTREEALAVWNYAMKHPVI